MKNKPIKLILKIILCLVVFAVVLLPAVYINTIYGYLPALFLLIFGILSFVWLLIVRKGISIDSNSLENSCERGANVSIGLKICNNSILFCPKASAKIYISDLFGSPASVVESYMTLASKSENKLSFDMDMPHIGVYHVGIREMRIYDFLGIFSFPVKVDGTYEVYVTPKLYPIEDIHQEETLLEESVSNNRTTSVGGTDYVGVRAYEPGDSMKQIHWKLSAHSLDYMTKVHESSRELSFSVILDFTSEKNKDKEVVMDINDALVETALSVVNEIAKSNANYWLIYCDKDNNLKRRTPNVREDVLSLIRDFHVIETNPGREFLTGSQILEEEGHSSSKSSNCIICTGRVDEAMVQELITIKRQHRVPELFQIVPAGLTSRDIENLKGKLAQLDEADITYHFVYTTDAGGRK